MKYDSDTLKQLRELEQLQTRSLVELALDPDDAEAKFRMRERKLKIDALRRQLSTYREST